MDAAAGTKSATDEPEPVPEQLREAMRRFASGVTIVTTADADGTWKGFTASAFCSLSLAPPLVLVCQGHSSSSHDSFTRCDRFIVNVLAHDHTELAKDFARSGGNKFEGGRFRPGHTTGLPVLPDALAVLGCDVHARYDGGDHDIYVGRVRTCRVRDGEPMLHFDSSFRRLADGLAD
jgi:flavin reductase ActVB